MSADLPGPFFVGCLANECEGKVFGPLWTYEHAADEADATDGRCDNAHLICRTVGDSVQVLMPPSYVWGGEGTTMDDLMRAVAWHDERRERLGEEFAHVEPETAP